MVRDSIVVEKFIRCYDWDKQLWGSELIILLNKD